jgi:hypothetical protein
MKTGDKVEKNGEYGIIMNINNNVAYVWWNVQGRYNWEPCDIETLNLILTNEEVDSVVLQEECLTDNDVDRLVDWVLSVKSATS